jgi:hypothetical protein
MSNLETTLRRETEAAKAVLEGIRLIIGPDDADLVSNTVEGETDLLSSIDMALAEIDETEVLISGLKEKEGQFFARRRAMEERAKRFRALIEQAMAITELARLRRPAATLSLRSLPPDVVVLNEADVPSEFFVPQPPPPPKLNKAALKEALKTLREKVEGVSALSDPEERAQALAALPMIPGATLNNGSVSLQIRRS